MKKILLTLTALLLFSFSIFTDDDGNRRKYRESDLPFSYRVHTSTPDAFLPFIKEGANVWTDVDGAFFKFTYGGKTSSSTVSRDGVNLVYFDSEYENFTPNSSVIAFSSTFTSLRNTPGFRADESDLIWNSGDFPPALNESSVDPGSQDLQSVIAHEFGHHLGLGHSGESGSPPGVGEEIRAATMFGLSSSGDTTKRSLHEDDILGVIGIYPRWMVDVAVTDAESGEVFSDYIYYLNGAYNAIISSKQFTTTWQEPGRANNDTAIVRNKLSNRLIVDSDSFMLSVQRYGYEPFDTTLVFSDTTVTQEILQAELKLKAQKKNTVTLALVNATAGDTLNADFALKAETDFVNEITLRDTIDNNSSLELQLSSDTYKIEIYPQLPYAQQIIENISISSDTSITLVLEEAGFVIIDDDNADDAERVDFFLEHLENDKNEKVAYLNTATEAAKLAKPALDEIETVIWLTGENASPVIADSLHILENILNNENQNLILSGNKIFSAIDDSTFIKDVLFAEFSGINTGQLLRGIEGEFISEHQIIGISNASPEALTLDESSGAEPVYQYLGKQTFGAYKFADSSKFVIFSFAMEDILPEYNPDAIFDRTLDWLDQVTDIAEERAIVPQSDKLYANYPNPFNPSTTIHFSLASSAKVELTVYNALGQVINRLVQNKNYTAGSHYLTWDGRNASGQKVSSGIYYYRLQTDRFTQSRKMVLIK